MRVSRKEAIFYLYRLKENPVAVINEIDSEVEFITLDIVLKLAIKALEQSPKPNSRAKEQTT